MPVGGLGGAVTGTVNDLVNSGEVSVTEAVPAGSGG